MKKSVWKFCSFIAVFTLCITMLAACSDEAVPSSDDESIVSTSTDNQSTESAADISNLENNSYDPVTGEMVIYRPWANFTIFYGDFRYSDELVPLGKVESGLEFISGKTENFTGVLELIED